MHFTLSPETAGRFSGTGSGVGDDAAATGAGVIGGGSAAGAREAGDPGGGPSLPPIVPQAETASVETAAANASTSFM